MHPVLFRAAGFWSLATGDWLPAAGIWRFVFSQQRAASNQQLYINYTTAFKDGTAFK
jgi:hypothetical protein